MLKRGRHIANWTTDFLRLNYEQEYSLEELETIFSQNKDAIEGQIRKLNAKPCYYLKIKKTTRRAFFRGKDIRALYKKRILLESNFLPKLIQKDLHDIVKLKISMQKKIDLYLARESKFDKDLRKEVIYINEIQTELTKVINEKHKAETESKMAS